MTLREWIVRRARPSPGAYLSALLVGVMVTATVITVLQRSPSDPVPLAAVTTLVTLIVALLLWLRDPLSPVRSGVLPWFLIALMAMWAYQVVMTLSRGEGPRYSSLVFPAAIVLVALRTPVGKPAYDAVTVFAWSVVGASAVTLVLEAAGLLPGNADGAGASAFELTEYFLPLSDLLNIDGRWAGPFGHPNLAGPMGAYLLIVGLARSGITRIVLALSGLTILLLTGSRGSTVAALVGVAVLATVHWWTRPNDVSRKLGVLVALGVAVGAGILVVARNPGLTGRTAMWPQMMDLLRVDPWFGVGSSGIWRAIDDGMLPEWAIHAHNVFLDAAVRTGIVGLVLCLIVLGLAAVVTVSAARQGNGLGLALACMIVTAGLTDNVLLWGYLTGGVMVLVLAVLVSAPSAAGSARLQRLPAPARGNDPVPDPGPSAAAD